MFIRGSDPRADRRFVYFIEGEGTGLVKIGVANCARARVRQLQSASPCKLTLLGVVETDKAGTLEREVHRRYADTRAHGEWFRKTDDLSAYIAAEADWPPPNRKTPRA